MKITTLNLAMAEPNFVLGQLRFKDDKKIAKSYKILALLNS